MTLGLHFAPDALRARRLDGRMHDELAARLGGLDGDSRPHGLGGALRTVLEGLKTGVRLSPEAFALHGRFVEALAEQRFELAHERLAQFSRTRPWRGGLDLGADGAVAQGFALIEGVLPELAGELRGFVREVRAGPAPATRPWGAAFVEVGVTPLAAVEQLSREAAEHLLIGLRLRAVGASLKGLGEAFVAARIHWAMTGLADSGRLTAADRVQARATAHAQAAAFEATAASLDVSGLALTLFRSASAHMDRPAEVRWAA